MDISEKVEAECGLSLDSNIAASAAQVRAKWNKATRYIRQKGVVTINGKRVEPERLMKILKQQNCYKVPCIHVFDVDRYRFGMSPWVPTALHI